MVAAHRPKEIKYATSKLLKFKIEVDHLVPKISVIHIPGNYIRQGCTVPKIECNGVPFFKVVLEC